MFIGHIATKLLIFIASSQSAGAVEYADYTTTEG